MPSNLQKHLELSEANQWETWTQRQKVKNSKLDYSREVFTQSTRCIPVSREEELGEGFGHHIQTHGWMDRSSKEQKTNKMKRNV